MAKYLVEANYVGDGIKGLLKEGARVGAPPSRRPPRPSAAASTPSTTPSARPTPMSSSTCPTT